VERWESIAGRVAEVLHDYERRTGRTAFRSGHNVAEILNDIADECFELEVIASISLGEGVLGELDLDGKKISVSQDLEPDRRVFTVAHEIGHAALGHSPQVFVDFEEHVDEQVGVDELEVQDGVYQAYNSRDLLEIEANLFAAELLAPTKLVLEATSEDPVWTVEDLTEKFGVSQMTMLTQLANVLLVRRGVAAVEEAEAPQCENDTPGAPALNADQEDAVTAETPALVIAGPGAGKTRVLAERYARLARSGVSESSVLALTLGGVIEEEDSILALTFSNKAAEEMRVRVAGMLGGGYREIQTYTFHGFCLQLLKSYGYLVDLPESFTLLTEMDASLLIRNRLHQLDLSYLENLSDPGLYVPGLLDAISRAKDELRTPEEFRQLAREWSDSAEGEEDKEAAGKAVEASQVYAAYQGWLREGGYVDYGDLMWLVIEVLKHPGAGEEIRGKYRQILVDEFQDINFASGRLLRALDGGRGVVWAVADPDQSIYGFRGASPANLSRFEDDYPGFRTVPLMKNYRSVPDIVGACQGLRSPLTSEGEGSEGPPLLEATRPGSETPAVSLVVTPDRDAELDRLVQEIRGREKRGVPLGTQAVLCSSNAQARRVVARLTAAGLAAQGPTSLLGSEEIKNTLAVVSLLREGGGAGLLRVAAFKENCLAEQDVVNLLVWAREQGCTGKDALARCGKVDNLSKEAIECLEKFRRFLDAMPYRHDAWHAVLTYAFHPESRLRELFSDPSDEARRRLLQVGQLAVLARSFGEREGLVENDGVLGFLEYVRELAASNKGDGALFAPFVKDAIQVMTVHKSKGLEFPVVYVPHLAKGHFPVRGGGGGKVPLPPGLSHHSEPEDKDKEDRCLFYVALTRAEDELVLSRAEVYGRKAGALPLIDRLVREAGGRVLLEEKGWTPETPGVLEGLVSGEAPGAGNSSQTKTVYSFRDLERYSRCSLQFRFAEVLGLPEKRSAYQSFHNSVYRVLDEMELEAERTGRNPELSWVKDLLARVWEEEGPTEHFYEPVYRRYAEKAVENWQASGEAPRWQVREKLSFTAPDGTRIEVMADAIRRDEDGSIVVARHRFGRPRQNHKEGHYQDRYALYVAACRETWPELPVRVELHYLTTGETLDTTPTERVTKNRTDKFRGHVKKARAGHYPANPGRECKSCPWNLMCPCSV
jgi:DNA helicase-2/ATP-dependent DNA helicase PcrA